jgi:hypothetical protein
MQDLTTALAGAKATFELLAGAIRARDSMKIDDATLQLRRQLFEMSDIAMSYIEKNAALASANAQLVTANAEQAKAHAKLEAQLLENQNYSLQPMGDGAFVYKYEPPVEGPQAVAHYLCQPCKDKGMKSVLRHEPSRLVCVEVKEHAIWLIDQAQRNANMDRNIAAISGKLAR